MTSTSTHVRRLILGTAGHIDHGKTSLVKRLTGTWTDTLPEERERGMTIDVGYAEFALPDGTEIGLLDVPGHERLVRTMVAAATAMDLALLVVAADDGPMPQTREHVEILDVLGVERLVVALTKCDLADAETAEIAEEEIRELLEPTGMAGARIVRVSSETGEGFEALREALAAAIPPPRGEVDDPHVFRMSVLRRFLVPGRGAVLTGIPVSGSIRVGDRVDVLPPGWTGKVRAIQVHHRDAEVARRGHRAALALSDVQVDKVKRGMVLASAGVLRTVDRLAAKVRILGGVRKPLAHGDRARLHVGADQVVVRVHLPGRKPIAPGQEGIVELESVTPLSAAPGDKLVLRAENASATLGGGVVLELLEARLKRRPGIVESLEERARVLGDPQALVRGCLAAAGDRGTTLPDVCAQTALRPDVLPGLVRALAEVGEVVPAGRGGRWVQAAAFDRVQRRVDEAVRKLHEKDVAVPELSLAAVRAAVGRLEPAVVEEAIQHLVSKGRLVRTPAGGVHHKDHSSELPERDRERCERVSALLARGAGRPPEVEDLEAEAGLSTPETLRALKLLEARGRAFKTETHWFDGAFVETAKEKIRAFAAEHGGFKPADARDILDTTRKWLIPFLEALDKSGFSRRVGDRRVLRDS